MLYEVTHFVQKKVPWIWDIIEWGNSELFALQHRKSLMDLPLLLDKYTDRFVVSMAVEADVAALANFFAKQPEDAFIFFNPHGFDVKSLTRLVFRKSFLMFLVKDGNEIVGYFFLRCFANGTAFKGRIVDAKRRNQGIGKFMGDVINDVVMNLGVRLFTTISPDNYASFASAKAVNDIRIVRTLENGYYYIECLPKGSSAINGGD